jgi:isoleucyl-tRNA synthetase
VTLALVKLIAPVMPFMAEEMYQNLKGGADAEASVHHCRFPEPDAALLDARASAEMDAIFRVTSLALAARKSRDIRVRQPLPVLTVHPLDEGERDACRKYAEILADEINVKKIDVREPGEGLDCAYTVKPNFKKLGPKLGKLMQKAKEAFAALGAEEIGKLAKGRPAALVVEGQTFEILPEEAEVIADLPADLVTLEELGTRVALSTALTPALEREGVMRDLLRKLQAQRKECGLEIEDRVRVAYRVEGETLAQVVAEWKTTLAEELLAVAFDEASDEALAPLDVQGGIRSR